MRKKKKSDYSQFDDDFIRQKVLSQAYLLLKIRQQSEKEIKQKLQNFLYSHNINTDKSSTYINPVINQLKNQGLINDREFVHFWIESRLRGKPKGKYIIIPELLNKGVEKDVIDEELRLLQKEYPEEQLIEKLISKGIKKYSGLSGNKLKEKLLHYVVSKGFSYDKVRVIIDERHKIT